MPLRYSEGVENLVPIQKKNGEIRLCEHFQNLNRVSLKDNYPLPKMDYILQKVVGSANISMMDDFSSYNQVAIHPDHQKEKAFVTPCGTFMYACMPFGLINTRATFQRAMDIAFLGEQNKFVVVYLDDITVLSKTDEEHILYLKLTFEKCRRYGLFLNPKKSQFSLSEGKVLGHIVE